MLVVAVAGSIVPDAGSSEAETQAVGNKNSSNMELRCFEPTEPQKGRKTFSTVHTEESSGLLRVGGLFDKGFQGGEIERETRANALVFSADGSRLAVGGESRTLHLIDATKPKGESEEQEISFDAKINACAFSPCGDILAVGLADCKLVLFDMTSLTEMYTIDQQGAVLACAFSRDSRVVAVGGMDERLTLWNVSTKAVVRIFDRVASFAESESGQCRVLSCAFPPPCVWAKAPPGEQRGAGPLIVSGGGGGDGFSTDNSAGRAIQKDAGIGAGVELYDILAKGAAKLPPVLARVVKDDSKKASEREQALIKIDPKELPYHMTPKGRELATALSTVRFCAEPEDFEWEAFECRGNTLTVKDDSRLTLYDLSEKERTSCEAAGANEKEPKEPKEREHFCVQAAKKAAGKLSRESASVLSVSLTADGQRQVIGTNNHEEENQILTVWDAKRGCRLTLTMNDDVETVKVATAAKPEKAKKDMKKKEGGEEADKEREATQMSEAAQSVAGDASKRAAFASAGAAKGKAKADKAKSFRSAEPVDLVKELNFRAVRTCSFTDDGALLVVGGEKKQRKGGLALFAKRACICNSGDEARCRCAAYHLVQSEGIGGAPATAAAGGGGGGGSSGGSKQRSAAEADSLLARERKVNTAKFFRMTTTDAYTEPDTTRYLLAAGGDDNALEIIDITVCKVVDTTKDSGGSGTGAEAAGAGEEEKRPAAKKAAGARPAGKTRPPLGLTAKITPGKEEWKTVLKVKGRVLTCSFSRDGQVLALGDSAKRLTLFSAVNGKFGEFDHANSTSLPSDGEVRSVDFAPDGAPVLAFGGTDEKVTLYDYRSAVNKHAFHLHSPVNTARFSPDGVILAVGDDKRVTLFDTVGYTPLVIKDYDGYVLSVAFSGSGNMLAVGGNGMSSATRDAQLEKKRLNQLEERSKKVADEVQRVAEAANKGKVISLSTLTGVISLQVNLFKKQISLRAGALQQRNAEADETPGKAAGEEGTKKKKGVTFAAEVSEETPAKIGDLDGELGEINDPADRTRAMTANPIYSGATRTEILHPRGNHTDTNEGQNAGSNGQNDTNEGSNGSNSAPSGGNNSGGDSNATTAIIASNSGAGGGNNGGNNGDGGNNTTNVSPRKASRGKAGSNQGANADPKQDNAGALTKPKPPQKLTETDAAGGSSCWAWGKKADQALLGSNGQGGTGGRPEKPALEADRYKFTLYKISPWKKGFAQHPWLLTRKIGTAKSSVSLLQHLLQEEQTAALSDVLQSIRSTGFLIDFSAREYPPGDSVPAHEKEGALLFATKTKKNRLMVQMLLIHARDAAEAGCETELLAPVIASIPVIAKHFPDLVTWFFQSITMLEAPCSWSRLAIDTEVIALAKVYSRTTRNADDLWRRSFDDNKNGEWDHTNGASQTDHPSRDSAKDASSIEGGGGSRPWWTVLFGNSARPQLDNLAMSTRARPVTSQCTGWPGLCDEQVVSALVDIGDTKVFNNPVMRLSMEAMWADFAMARYKWEGLKFVALMTLLTVYSVLYRDTNGRQAYIDSPEGAAIGAYISLIAFSAVLALSSGYFLQLELKQIMDEDVRFHTFLLQLFKAAFIWVKNVPLAGELVQKAEDELHLRQSQVVQDERWKPISRMLGKAYVFLPPFLLAFVAIGSVFIGAYLLVSQSIKLIDPGFMHYFGSVFEVLNRMRVFPLTFGCFVIAAVYSSPVSEVFQFSLRCLACH
jgi:WD40 repeat protein